MPLREPPFRHAGRRHPSSSVYRLIPGPPSVPWTFPFTSSLQKVEQRGCVTENLDLGHVENLRLRLDPVGGDGDSTRGRLDSDAT